MSTQINCNPVWLIIISCFSSIKGKLANMENDVDGLNQKMAEALTTPELLSLSDEELIRKKLEKIEDHIVEQDKAILELCDFIQKKAEAFNKATP